MHEYMFDVKLFASIRVKAESEKAAREKLATMLDCATLKLEDPDPSNKAPYINGEVSMDGDADLMEIDGEEV
jgi:hypothetical protein